jgi:DNA-binding MarR family transcriptional regulator
MPRALTDADERMQAWALLLQSHSVLTDVLNRELEEAGLVPLTWYEVLLQLYSAPDGRLPMRRLADSVLLSKSGITRLVDRMAAEGLLERRPCTEDRRVIYAAITDRGRTLFRKAGPVHRRGINRHFSAHITDAEARAVKSALSKVLDAAAPAQPETGASAG